MKHTLVKVFVTVTLLAAFWPGHEKLTETYQEHMFTAPPDGRSFRFEARSLDLTFRTGATIEGTLMPWHRVRLGFPLAAITTDTQLQHRIFQLRCEGYPFLANVGMGSAIGFVGGCLLSIMRRNHMAQKQQGEQAGDGDA